MKIITLLSCLFSSFAALAMEPFPDSCDLPFSELTGGKEAWRLKNIMLVPQHPHENDPFGFNKDKDPESLVILRLPHQMITPPNIKPQDNEFK